MSFLKYPFNIALASLLQHFDEVCRKDLDTDNIVSERDYVSNLATHIRYPMGSLGAALIPPFTDFTALTSPGIYEQQLGGDGIIIISANTDENTVKHKIGVFEAKWPRLFGGSKHFYKPTKTGRKPTRKYRWDSWKQSKKIKKASRFSSQVELQRNALKMGFAVWQQFLSENPNGVSALNFVDSGSTCVLHEHTILHMNATPELYTKNPKHRRWENKDLLNIVNSYGMSFRDIILLMCDCKIGIPFEDRNGEIFAPFPSDAEGIPETSIIRNRQGVRIPLPNNENRGEIFQFMREFGLGFYSHFDLTNPKIRPFVIDSLLRMV